MVATNEYDKEKKNVGNIIDKSYIKTMKSYLSTNMSCNNGSKHNGTYGKYYGIGLINKYHLKDGLSFGHFKNKDFFVLDILFKKNNGFKFSIFMIWKWLSHPVLGDANYEQC